MQALKILLQSRRVLHKIWGHASCRRYSTRSGLCKSRSLNVSLVLNPKHKISVYANFIGEHSPLTLTRSLCSVPVSRNVVDSKASPDSEFSPLEYHSQESTNKLHQAGLHFISRLASEHNLPPSELAPDVAEELVFDSYMLEFFQYSPFLCSDSPTDSFKIDLAMCVDVPDVLKVLEANINDLSINNAGMAIGKLWQIVSPNFFIDGPLTFYSPHSLIDVSHSSLLDKLLLVIENRFHHLSDDKISCLLVHTCSLGIAQNSFLVHKMLSHFMSKCDSLPLKTLARLLLFLRSPDLNYFVKGKLMPILVKHLTECNNKSDFLLLNHCIENSEKLLPDSISELHSKKMAELLDTGEISSEDTKILLRMLHFTMRTELRQEYDAVRERACSMLVPKISSLNSRELVIVSNYCWQYKLGRQLMNSLYRQAALAMQDATDPVTRGNLYLGLSPERAQHLQSEMTSLVRNLMKNNKNEQRQMKMLYLLFRSRSIGDLDLLNEFWDRILRDLDETLSHPEAFRNDALGRETTICRVLFRYLHFNSNLGGRFRHLRLEARLIELLQKEINGVTGLLISRLSRMASFLVAYSAPRELPTSLLERLVAASSQFKLRDVVLLTRGLQTSQSLNSSCYHEKYMRSILSLAQMLSTRIQQLADESTNVNDLAILSRLSNTVDTVFSKYGARYPSLMSRNTRGYSPQPSVFPASSPPSTSSIIQSQTNSSPQDWSMSSFDNQPRSPSTWNDLPSTAETKEFPTQASVAVSLARCIHAINSRAASVLAQINSGSNFYNVQVLDGLLNYLHRNQHQVHGLTVAQVLECAYRVGHAPSLPLEGLRTLASVLAQDLSSLHGLPLITSTLSLSFYQSLPSSLIKKIFNVGFMDFLDKEMQNSFSKKHYPVRVRQALMELNRSVCIDYPESNVPWFHEEYCRDAIQTVPHKRDGFFAEVHQVLSQVLGGEGFFSSHTYSPYYYLMDFSFVLNDEGKAVAQPEKPSVLQPRCPETHTSLPPGYTRHCIHLLESSRFAQRHSISDTGKISVQPQLKGHLQLRQRHLEVLGYDVINISRHDWQSMSLGTAASKQEYIRNKIFSQRL